jgi:hypothetical protein
VARALIVGCGCRGRELARALQAAGWLVRGTSRREAALEEIRAAGAEGALADPATVASVIDHVGDVALLYWLMGDAVDAGLHGERLERLLAELVDTPVRGFVYEGAGAAGAPILREGARIARSAAERWRIPVEVVSASPSRVEEWRGAMAAVATRIASGAY